MQYQVKSRFFNFFFTKKTISRFFFLPLESTFKPTRPFKKNLSIEPIHHYKNQFHLAPLFYWYPLQDMQSYQQSVQAPTQVGDCFIGYTLD